MGVPEVGHATCVD